MADPTPERPDIGFPPSNPALLPWAEARRRLESAKTYWLTTVRPDGRPHVAPVWGVWLDDELVWSTGEGSRKARNLAVNPRCAVSVQGDGLDLVVEGVAAKLTDEAALQRGVVMYSAKYEWQMTVKDGGWANEDGHAGPVYVVRPAVVFGFGDAADFSATRWRFGGTG